MSLFAFEMTEYEIVEVQESLKQGPRRANRCWERKSDKTRTDGGKFLLTFPKKHWSLTSEKHEKVEKKE